MSITAISSRAAAETFTSFVHRDLIARGSTLVLYYDNKSVVKLESRGDDFVLRSTLTGEHVLAARCTDEARLRAHAEGFAEINVSRLMQQPGFAPERLSIRFWC